MDIINNFNLKSSGILNVATSVALYVNVDNQENKVILYLNEEKAGKRQEILKNVGILECRVDNTNKLMEQPLENGAVVVDHKIKNPTEISIELLINEEDNESIQELMKYNDNGTKIAIKAKTEFYNNMVIVGKPYSINSNILNKVVYPVLLKEVLSANTQFIALPSDKVKYSGDSSTVKGGHTQATINKSVVYQIKDGLRGFFK